MDIKVLKKAISLGCKLELPLVFIYTDNLFTCLQYVEAYAQKQGQSIEVVESLSESSSDILWDESTSNLQIYFADKFKMEELPDKADLIVIAKAADKKNENSVDFPELTKDNIRDYAYYLLEGVKEEYIEWLLQVSQYNIYRLVEEAKKLQLFPKTKRSDILRYMIDRNSFADLSQFTIFDISNALLSKDIKALSKIYTQVENIDVNIYALLSLLLSNFRGVIDIQVGGLNAEEAGLTPSRYKALNRYVNYYSRDQLLKIYALLTGIDEMIKDGKLESDVAVDYLMAHLLNIGRRVS